MKKFIRNGNKLRENIKIIFYVLLPQLIRKYQYSWRNCKVDNIDCLFGTEGLKNRYESLIESFSETILIIINNKE